LRKGEREKEKRKRSLGRASELPARSITREHKCQSVLIRYKTSCIACYFSLLKAGDFGFEGRERMHATGKIGVCGEWRVESGEWGLMAIR